MGILLKLLLLCLPLFAQDRTNPTEQTQSDYQKNNTNAYNLKQGIDLRTLQYGRPKLSSIPTYLEGLNVNAGLIVGTANNTSTPFVVLGNNTVFSNIISSNTQSGASAGISITGNGQPTWTWYQYAGGVSCIGISGNVEPLCLRNNSNTVGIGTNDPDNSYDLVANGGSILLGDGAQANYPQIYIYAKSVDGASQNGGCLGVINTNASGKLIWTSTTSVTATGIQAIPKNVCPSGSVCPFLAKGVVSVTMTGAATQGDCVQTSGTRCQATQAAVSLSNTCEGYILRTTGGAGAVEVYYP